MALTIAQSITGTLEPSFSRCSTAIDNQSARSQGFILGSYFCDRRNEVKDLLKEYDRASQTGLVFKWFSRIICNTRIVIQICVCLTACFRVIARSAQRAVLECYTDLRLPKIPT
jgi:hypothetical protein